MLKFLSRLAALALMSFSAAPSFAQAPPPVPALPDAERRTQYSISGTACACSVNFQLYGSAADVDAWLEVWVNGARYLSTDPTFGWSLSSATGSLATIPRPITNAVLTFNAAQTGIVQIVGAERPRRAVQVQENQGVPARAFNQAVTDLVAVERELWDKTNDVSGRAVLAPAGETLATLPTKPNRQGLGACYDSSGNLSTCIAIPTGTFSAGTGINFTGSGPTVVSAQIGTSGHAIPFLDGNNKFSGDALFASGRPWCDVRAIGALGNSSNDDTAAINACVTQLITTLGTGGIVYFPPSTGAYCTFSGISVSSALQITFLGAGENASFLDACGHDVTTLTMTTPGSTEARHTVSHMSINGDNTIGTTHPALQFSAFCIGCDIDHAVVQYGTWPLMLLGPDIHVYETKALNGYAGVVNVQAGMWFMRDKFDQNWTYPPVAPFFPAWISSHSYAQGNTVVVATAGVNAVLQESVATCTSSSGSAPVSPSYGGTVNDGTCTWIFEGPTNYYGMYINGVASETAIEQVDITGQYEWGLYVQNSSASSLVKVGKSIFGGSLTSAVFLNSGRWFSASLNEFGGCSRSACSTVYVSPTWTAQTSFTGNFFLGGATNLTIAGGTQLVATGNTFQNSTVDGVYAAPAVTRFGIVGNSINPNSGLAILVDTGASDYYNLIGNIVNGATVTDNGSGAHKTISGNN